MTAIITIALAMSVLANYVGENVTAHVVVHASDETTVIINGQNYSIARDETRTISTQFTVEKERDEKTIIVDAQDMRYTLRATIIGAKRLPSLWWLTIAPLTCFGMSVRVRHRIQNSKDVLS